MPWTADDAFRHDHQANTPAKRRKWAAIANAVLKRTGDEVLAIKTANARTESVDEAITPERKAWKKRGQTLRSMLEKGRRAEFERIGAVDPKELERHGIDPTKSRERKPGRPHSYPKQFTQSKNVGGWYMDAFDVAAALAESRAHFERQAKAKFQPGQAQTGAAVQRGAEVRRAAGIARQSLRAPHLAGVGDVVKSRLDLEAARQKGYRFIDKLRQQDAARARELEKAPAPKPMPPEEVARTRAAAMARFGMKPKLQVSSIDLGRTPLLYENEPTRVIEPTPPPPSSPRLRPQTVKLPKPSDSTKSVRGLSLPSLRRAGEAAVQRERKDRKREEFRKALRDADELAAKMAAMDVEKPIERPTFNPLVPERTPLKMPSVPPPSGFADRIQKKIQGEPNPKAAALLAQIRAIGK